MNENSTSSNNCIEWQQLSDKRIVAGLAIGGWFELECGTTVQVNRVVKHKHADSYNILTVSHDVGEISADDFLTLLRSGGITPVNGQSGQAHQYAIQSVQTRNIQ